jgi:hypothetical protein
MAEKLGATLYGRRWLRSQCAGCDEPIAYRATLRSALWAASGGLFLLRAVSMPGFAHMLPSSLGAKIPCRATTPPRPEVRLLEPGQRRLTRLFRVFA